MKAPIKRSSANILVKDTTGHVQKSCRVHALMHQGCFGLYSIWQVDLILWLISEAFLQITLNVDIFV